MKKILSACARHPIRFWVSVVLGTIFIFWFVASRFVLSLSNTFGIIFLLGILIGSLAARPDIFTKCMQRWKSVLQDESEDAMVLRYRCTSCEAIYTEKTLPKDKVCSKDYGRLVTYDAIEDRHRSPL